jgi:hypothetical protein
MAQSTLIKIKEIKGLIRGNGKTLILRIRQTLAFK